MPKRTRASVVEVVPVQDGDPRAGAVKTGSVVDAKNAFGEREVRAASQTMSFKSSTTPKTTRRPCRTGAIRVRSIITVPSHRRRASWVRNAKLMVPPFRGPGKHRLGHARGRRAILPGGRVEGNFLGLVFAGAGAAAPWVSAGASLDEPTLPGR
jgi:hypothetical protein